MADDHISVVPYDVTGRDASRRSVCYSNACWRLVAHHFVKPSNRVEKATHGLHLTEPGSALWRERLAFRDALRADEPLAAEYEGLKLRLALHHSEDAAAYTAGKRDFVADVLARAGIELGRR